MARFTQNTDPATIRAALIDDDMDEMPINLLVDIITACWSDFQPMAERYLANRWANAADIWDEAADRGYFEDDTTTD